MKINKITIKTVFGKIIWESEKETLREAVIEKYERDKDLRGADLRDAYLRGADLSGADLRGANLIGADLRSAYLRDVYLRGADLADADLRDAYLRDAYLSGADLRGANLAGANLIGADLSGAYLRGADLSGADLSGADLSGADLRSVYLRDAYLSGADLRGEDLSKIDLAKLPRDFINQTSRDMLFIFQCLKSELPFLKEKLMSGQINGSQYEGTCACLVGTIANAKNITMNEFCNFIPFYEKGIHNPGENWFLNIRKGDTPKNNPFAAHVLKLIEMVEAGKMETIVYANTGV